VVLFLKSNLCFVFTNPVRHQVKILTDQRLIETENCLIIELGLKMA